MQEYNTALHEEFGQRRYKINSMEYMRFLHRDLSGDQALRNKGYWLTYDDYLGYMKEKKTLDLMREYGMDPRYHPRGYEW